MRIKARLAYHAFSVAGLHDLAAPVAAPASPLSDVAVPRTNLAVTHIAGVCCWLG